MMISILLPIWFVNIGYDAGVELTSLHILSLALLLLVRDSKRFWEILIEHKAVALTYIPKIVFPEQWKNTGRLVLKGTFIILFLVYRGFGYGNLYASGKSFKLPLDNGLEGTNGLYRVSEFKINNRSIPDAAGDTTRWQNVVFEKFNSISVKIDKPFKLNTKNSIRTTEYYGNIGRYYFGYKADTINKVLILSNRADTTSKLILHYEKPDSEHFILSGINEQRDSIYVVLNKIDKKYPLEEKRK